MFFAFLLIILGVIFLLKNLGIITGDLFGIIWPLVLILLGVWIIVLRYEWKFRTHRVMKKFWEFVEK
ncbi:hypothetical protein KAW43_00900 [Candidatus Parcubacteria bacterium]|nr:hypothetical protein [Candidatus Parcubacteria bacterium]